jgi:hypothetical protein
VADAGTCGYRYGAPEVDDGKTFVNLRALREDE